MSILPSNILKLNEKNEALLSKMNFDSDHDDPRSLRSVEAYNSTGLFTPTMIDEMFSNRPPEHHTARRTVARSIGMILVRPDMVHVSNEFEGLITNQYELLWKQSVIMDAKTYWEIYRHDLYRPATMYSSLTRAALYIGSACNLMVFRDPSYRTAVPTADHVHDILRGSQGTYEPNTLRGDIVYRNAMKLDLHRLSDSGVDPRTRRAVDPFGAYRALARNPSKEIAGLRYPLLFYTGVGVHVPDYAEIHTDLPQLLSSVEMV